MAEHRIVAQGSHDKAGDEEGRVFWSQCDCGERVEHEQGATRAKCPAGHELDLTQSIE